MLSAESYKIFLAGTHRLQRQIVSKPSKMLRANTQQSPDDPAELQKYVERVGRESVASKVKTAMLLPIQIDTVLRPGAQLNQRLVVNKVALLLYRCGIIAEVKCFACQRGEGPLVECVRQSGFMDG